MTTRIPILIAEESVPAENVIGVEINSGVRLGRESSAPEEATEASHGTERRISGMGGLKYLEKLLLWDTLMMPYKLLWQ